MAAAWRRSRRGQPDWNFSLTCWSITAIGCLPRGLILFGNVQSKTVLHVGSFASPILAFVACAAGLQATLPCFAIYYCCLAAVLMLAIYIPMLEPEDGTEYSTLALALSGLSLFAFIAVALRTAPPGSHNAADRLAATIGRRWVGATRSKTDPGGRGPATDRPTRKGRIA